MDSACVKMSLLSEVDITEQLKHCYTKTTVLIPPLPALCACTVANSIKIYGYSSLTEDNTNCCSANTILKMYTDFFLFLLNKSFLVCYSHSAESCSVPFHSHLTMMGTISCVLHLLAHICFLQAFRIV